MKFIYIFLLASYFAIFNVKAQSNNFPNEPCEFYCVYKLTFQQDSTNSWKKSEDMRLLISKSSSEFQSIGNYTADSLYRLMAATPGGPEKMQFFLDKRMSLPQSRFHYKIYKHRPTNTTYIYEKILSKTYRYTEELHLNWTIDAEKKDISGFSCQKATTSFAGRSYVAWFTREIPVSDGPYKFYGLPGLIIEVSDTRQQFQFKLIKLSKSRQNESISLPKQAFVATTKESAQRALRDYHNNLPNLVPLDKPQDKQNLRNDLKSKYNNSLELR